ncbi:MAG: hypothetical protein NZ578_06100 [Candidatus Binatia bacterium]|nr:hypothetical protein [Candidatus Binatia bacterium]
MDLLPARQRGSRFRLPHASVLLCFSALLLPRLTWAAFAYTSASGTSALRLSGYIKTLALGLRQDLPGTPDTALDLTRARFMVDGKLGSHFSWSVHYEHAALFQRADVTATGLFTGSAATRRHSLLPLDWTVQDTNDLLWRHELDRLAFRVSLPTVEMVVGRQAISWGVGRFWNPLDLFRAFSPVEIDREYKAGVDAIRFEWALGSFSQIEMVYAAVSDEFARQSLAVKGRKTVGNFDLGGMAGKFFRDIVIGPFLDGEVSGVGMRGEATLTHNTAGRGQGQRTFLRGVASIDYRFANGLYTLLEYYFNGFGKEAPADYPALFHTERVRRGEIFNFGRQYLGGLLEYEFHPLVRGDVVALWNLLDHSVLLSPLLAVSLSDEADIRLGAYFPLGTGLVGSRVRSEFGLYPQVYYLQLRLYF